MAQFNKVSQDFLDQERSLFEVNMIANKNGQVVTVDNPFPVSLGSSNITINGDITIPGIVTVTSSPQNPVHNHITEVGISSILTTPYLPVGVGTVNLNLSYLPVGISSLLNTVSISNTSFYVTAIGSTVNVSGTVAVSSITSPVTVTGTITAVGSTSSPTYVQYIDGNNTQMDSANRLRVAQSGQQWFYVPTVDKDGDLRYNESFVGTGCTSTYIQNLASIRYTAGISTNGYFTRGSRRRFKFRPSISHQWTAVVNWCGRDANCTKRRGVFTPYNGFFYEVTDDLYVVVRRRLIDGTLVEDRVKRDNFNNDMLNGTGPSGFNFNNVGVATITSRIGISSVAVSATETVYNATYTVSPASIPFKPGDRVTVTGVTSTTHNGCAMVQSVGVGSTTITLTYHSDPGTYTSITNGLLTSDGFHKEHAFWFDFNGDRTCRVRFGMEINGGTSILHTFSYGNTLGTQIVNAPAMMDRAEIFNTGIASHAPSMTSSGSTFNIEAEVELNPGFGNAHNNTALLFTKGSGQTFPILGVGLRAGEPYHRGDLQIQGIQLADLGNINSQQTGLYFYRLLLNPTIGGSIPTPTNIGKCTRQWAYTTGNTVTGGTELYSGYFNNNIGVDVRTALNFFNMGSDLSYNNPDFVVLVVTELAGGTANGQIVGMMNLIESL